MEGMQHAGRNPPFLKILPWLCAGIAMGWYGWGTLHLFAMLGMAGIAITLWEIRSGARRKPGNGWWKTCGIWMVIVSLGACIQISRHVSNKSDWIGKHEQVLRKETSQKKPLLVLRMLEPPEEKPASHKLTCAIEGGIERSTESKTGKASNVSFKQLSGNIYVYIRKETNATPPGYGQRFLVKGTILPITSSGNPGAFDYAGWCRKAGFYHQIWADTGDISIASGFHGNRLQEWLFAVREKLLKEINVYVKDSSASGIAKALLVGYRHGIDEDLNQAYVRTGVVHIIAISGMHLAMLFGLLSQLPGRRKNRKWWLFRNLVILVCVWLFTLLSGASPSILRAATMLTLLMLANQFAWVPGGMNNLLAAAFGLLAFEPMFLWNIGFQLSFAAVGGLLLFGKKLTAIYNFSHPLLRWCWELQCISVAAQTLTTPLVLYYFHQFPLVFMLSNMVAIPLAGWVLPLEILLCAVLWFPPLARGVGWVIEWLLRYLNAFITELSGLPFCVVENINVNRMQILACYAMLAGTAYWLNHKATKGLLLTLAAVLAFCSERSREILLAEQQRQLVIFQVSRISAFAWVDGRTMFLRIPEAGTLSDIQKEQLWKWALYPAMVHFRIKELRSAEPLKEGAFVIP